MADALKSDVKNLKTFIETHGIAVKDEIEIVLKFAMQHLNDIIKLFKSAVKEIQQHKWKVLQEAIEKIIRFPEHPTARNVAECVENTLIPILEIICTAFKAAFPAEAGYIQIAQGALEAARIILKVIAQFLPDKSSLKVD